MKKNSREELLILAILAARICRHGNHPGYGRRGKSFPPRRRWQTRELYAAQNTQTVPQEEDGEDLAPGENVFFLEAPRTDRLNPDFYYYAIQKELISSDGKAVIEYDVKLPQLRENGAASERINQQIWETYQSLLAAVKARLDAGTTFREYHRDREADHGPQGDGALASPIYHYIYQANYRITLYSSKYLCVLIEEYENTGGAHGMPYRDVLIFRVADGLPAAQDSLFAENREAWEQKKEEAFAEEIRRQPELYWENAMDTVRRDSETSRQGYYLTREGVVFYYAPYELAPYAAGYVEALVPYAQLPLK
ncbi:MAG: DUF3298 and DUF4163 domain-containing protein [Clostridium sp.]|jgi:hypothetical protein|nr:DUF3298 and DUF4163 domain-containing protein [Clostridium sp.]